MRFITSVKVTTVTTTNMTVVTDRDGGNIIIVLYLTRDTNYHSAQFQILKRIILLLFGSPTTNFEIYSKIFSEHLCHPLPIRWTNNTIQTKDQFFSAQLYMILVLNEVAGIFMKVVTEKGPLMVLVEYSSVLQMCN